MPSLIRGVGRRLRKLVLPLVGFWHLFGRLEDLCEHLGTLQKTTRASFGLITEAQDALSVRMARLEMTVEASPGLIVRAQDTLLARIGGSELAAEASFGLMMQAQDGLSARVGRLESTAATSSELITRAQGVLTALNSTLVKTVAAEIERLDSYLCFHADTLRASVEALQGNLDLLGNLLQTIANRPQYSYLAPGIDALLTTAGYDLIVPTDEAGLLAYIMRHGLPAIEPGVRAILLSHLKPGATAVDAGANIGIHSISMASAVGPSGCVVCFEPLPHLARSLERTLQLNGFSKQARVQPMALSDTHGEATLYRAAHGPMSSLYLLPETAGTEAIPVRMITLDECFTPGARVDLVKMDVEGAEPRVWRGMRRILRDNPGIEVISEWSASHFRRSGEDPVAYMAEIRAAGFSPFIIAEDGAAVPLRDDVNTIEASNLLLTRRPQGASA